MNKPNKPEDFANWAIGIEDASTPLQAIIDHIIDDEAFPVPMTFPQPLLTFLITGILPNKNN